MLPDLKSLAARLFKLVFGWYLALAIAVTAVQLGVEYSAIRATIAGDLEAIARSFSSGVADALWTYDGELLNSLAKGIAQTAIVTGVKIENSRGELLASEGILPVGEAADSLLAPFQMHALPLASPVVIAGHDARQLGRLTLYSDRSVAVDRVRYSFIVILINSIIKSLGLWLIFYWAITWRLSRPLRQLSAAVSRLDFDHTGQLPPPLEYPHRDEIGLLVASLNAMQSRLHERTVEVQRAQHELEDFSYSMSHDLRTPLRALDGYSKVLLDEYDGRLDAEGRRLLEGLRDNAQRMARQMDDMLLFMHLGRQRIEYAEVELGALAREAFAALQAAAPRPALRLHVGELPPAWADRRMMQMLLANLLSNAVRFSPPDRAATIDLGCVAAPDEDRYFVADHGEGFDPRYAGKLFRMFEHAHSTGRRDGAGVGLAIVKRIVERHGGRVWAEGRPGDGATFHFALPRRPRQATERALAERAATDGGALEERAY